jgi:glutamyl-tRNA synthetase
MKHAPIMQAAEEHMAGSLALPHRRSADLSPDGFCRERGLEFAPGRALRFRTPDEGVTVIEDVVRGTVEFPNAAMEDFVVARGNGSPVFLLANVADDIAQRITLVVRGEEHLSNAPKQALLWHALAAKQPTWAHLPLIVNERRQKLSKRRDKVALEDYLVDGYLPDALVNYLMLLGWGPRDGVEVRPFAQMAELFRFEDVTRSPAFFDVRKLGAINANYLRALTPAEFAQACRPWLSSPAAPWPQAAFDATVFNTVAPLAQTRLTVLSEITSYVDFLFLDEPAVDETSWGKAMTARAAELLTDVRAGFADREWTATAVKSVVESTADKHELKLSKAQAPLRVAVTGRSVGLPLFESIETLGRERTMSRIDTALRRLSTAP